METGLDKGLPGDPKKSSIVPTGPSGEMVDVESTRAQHESQAGFLVAQKFPRDEEKCVGRIIQSCNRKSLAEQAEYAFPRGGSVVRGPSIRLAEVIAQNWGNIQSGIREIGEVEGASLMMAYCYDLETNTRNERIFTVKHVRKARGVLKKLDDPRDIYEMNFNQGARRLRACILQTVPGDVIELAVETCRATLEKSDDPMEERIEKMLEQFSKYKVSQEMIEAALEKPVADILAPDLVQLRTIFTSIRDGMAKVQDYFEFEATSDTDELKQKLAEQKKKAEPEKEPAKKGRKSKKAEPKPKPEPEPESEPETPPDDPPEAPPEPPPEPPTPEAEEPRETVTEDSEPSKEEDKSELWRTDIKIKAGRRSSWKNNYEARRTKASDLGMSAEDWHEQILGILEEHGGVKNINDLDVTKRIPVQKAIDAMLAVMDDEE